MISPAIRTYLLSIPEIVAIIETRIYPGWFPEKATFPALAYLQISGVAHHDLPIAYPRYQFSAIAQRYADAVALAAEVRNALERYKGDMGGNRIIQGVWMGSRDMYEEATKLYHIATDFKIIYRE